MCLSCRRNDGLLNLERRRFQRVHAGLGLCQFWFQQNHNSDSLTVFGLFSGIYSRIVGQKNRKRNRKGIVLWFTIPPFRERWKELGFAIPNFDESTQHYAGYLSENFTQFNLTTTLYAAGNSGRGLQERKREQSNQPQIDRIRCRLRCLTSLTSTRLVVGPQILLAQILFECSNLSCYTQYGL